MPPTSVNLELFYTTGVAFLKETQSSFRNSKLRDATIQTDHKFGRHEDSGLIYIFQSAEVDADLCVELAQVL